MSSIRVESDENLQKPPKSYPHGYTVAICEHCNSFVALPKRCSSRFCIPCQKWRGRRVRKRLYWLLKQHSNARGFTWKKIELTIRSSFDLESQVDSLIKAFRRLRQRKWWKKLVRSGAYVIEVTYTEGVGWHAHIHAIIFARFMPQAVLSRIWNRCSRGSPIVFIRALKDDDHAVNYICFYLTKVSKLTQEQRSIADGVLIHRRLFAVFQQAHVINRRYRPDKVPLCCPKCGASDGWYFEWDFQRKDWDVRKSKCNYYL